MSAAILLILCLTGAIVGVKVYYFSPAEESGQQTFSPVKQEGRIRIKLEVGGAHHNLLLSSEPDEF